MHILALEASTTSAKAMLYDTDEKAFKVETAPYISEYEDKTILSAEAVYNQMIALGRRVCAGEKVDAISLGGTWHSVALFDKQIRSVTPVYLWSYTGAAELCKKLRGDEAFVHSYYKRTGCMVNAIYPFFKLLLLKNSYDLSKYYIMGQGSYNNYRMTGKRISTACMLSGSGLLNINSGEYDEELLSQAGITAGQLCEIVTSRCSYPLTREAAAALGVSEGIPVLPANSDGGLNQVGAGAIGKNIMTFSVGTSGAIRMTTEEPVLPDDCSTWCYRSPVAWLSGAATNGCCNCVDWFKRAMFDPAADYAQIEAGITDRQSTPVFLPFIYGERCPGWEDERCGEFKLLKPNHTRYDMYLAVQEGVLFNLYHCYKVLSSVNGEAERIKFSGGILNSPSWSQMCADIFQRDLDTDRNEHSSLIGGVVLAMELLGAIHDMRDYRPLPSRVIVHDPSKAEFYKKKFDLYLQCYNAVRLR